MKLVDLRALTQSLAEAARPMGKPNCPAGHIPPPDKPCCAHLDGYSLHSDVSVKANHHVGLERLLKFGVRPALSQRRLSLTPSRKVHYRLGKPSIDGRTYVELALEDYVR